VSGEYLTMAHIPHEANGFRLSAAKFLDEDAVRRNLLLSALHLFAFEVLKNAIVADVKAFLVFDESDADEAREYEARLRSLHTIQRRQRNDTERI
jgi:hypothetical protein